MNLWRFLNEKFKKSAAVTCMLLEIFLVMNVLYLIEHGHSEYYTLLVPFLANKY